MDAARSSVIQTLIQVDLDSFVFVSMRRENPLEIGSVELRSIYAMRIVLMLLQRTITEAYYGSYVVICTCNRVGGIRLLQ